MKNIVKFTIIAAAALLVWGGFKVYEGADTARTMKTYSSSEISFEYPALYHLEEKAVTGEQRNYRQIILTEDTEENRLVREGKSPGREGPVAITIDIFPNTLGKQTLMQFVTGESDSNYKLGAGKVSTTTIGSQTGLEYYWSGLYEGRSFVTSNSVNIYHFAVAFMNYDAPIVDDFEAVLSTVEIK
jgi:hypothetical protein